MNDRNKAMLSVVILCALCLAGCGKKEDQKGEIITENQAVQVDFETYSKDYYAEDKTLLLTVKKTIPVVRIAENSEASAEVNRQVKDFDIQGMSVDEAVKWAQEDYLRRGKDNWYGYSMETTYSAQREDNVVISFVTDAYSYMGGAHGNMMEAALNFDTQTGKRLMLTDVTIDERKATEEIVADILAQTKQEKYKDMFFEGYESSVGDLLSEDTWYLGKDGFHVIGNEYIISPHVVGILDFVIPYETADFLKEEYRTITK